MNLTPTDHALARHFAGSLERRPARRSIDEVGTQDFTVEFDVDGARYSLAQMLSVNVDDEEFCEWAKSAKPGDRFPAFVECTAVAA